VVYHKDDLIHEYDDIYVEMIDQLPTIINMIQSILEINSCIDLIHYVSLENNEKESIDI